MKHLALILTKTAYVSEAEALGAPMPDQFAEFVGKLRPGDIILIKGNSSAAGPKLWHPIRTAFNKNIRWGHAAIYAGDGKIVHMYGNTNPGHGTATAGYVREHNISTLARERDDILALRPEVPEEQKREAIERAYAMKGMSYDYVDLIRSAVFPGKESKKNPNKLICSAVIAYSYPDILFRPGVGRQYTRPGDIFTSNRMTPVAAYSTEREE